MRPASRRSAKGRSKSDPISERVEVAGARAATFRLVERGEGSFDLFRSGKKIGTARVEKSGDYSAWFAGPDGKLEARALETSELLLLVGRYLLTLDARAAASAEETSHKVGKTAEEKLSLSFLKKAKLRHLAALDERLSAMRRSIASIGKAS